VVEEGTFFSLESSNVKFARLKKGLCGVLRSIGKTNALRLRAFVLTKDLRAADQSWSPHTAPTFPLEINLYGSKLEADAIGAALSKAGHFIQFPRHGLAGSQYHNPHILCIEGHDSHSIGSVGSQISTEDTSSGSHSQAAARNGYVEVDAEDNGAAVESILDSLTHNVQVAETPVDRRIKRKLLQYIYHSLL
jgi:hypothetical protein